MAKLQRNLIGLESGSESGSGRILIFEIRPNPVPAGFEKTESGAALNLRKSHNQQVLSLHHNNYERVSVNLFQQIDT